MKVSRDGIVFDIADVAIDAAVRNGYEVVDSSKAAVSEKPSNDEPKKEAKKK